MHPSCDLKTILKEFFDYFLSKRHDHYNWNRFMIIYVTDIVIIPMKLNIFTCTKVVRRSKAGGPKWGSMTQNIHRNYWQLQNHFRTYRALEQKSKNKKSDYCCLGPWVAVSLPSGYESLFVIVNLRKMALFILLLFLPSQFRENQCQDMFTFDVC